MYKKKIILTTNCWTIYHTNVQTHTREDLGGAEGCSDDPRLIFGDKIRRPVAMKIVIWGTINFDFNSTIFASEQLCYKVKITNLMASQNELAHCFPTVDSPLIAYRCRNAKKLKTVKVN